MTRSQNAAELQMNAAGLYREEVVTDRRVGSIRILTPVTAEGLTDPMRKVLYVGEAQVLTPGGVLPLAFELEAGSLREAIDKFAAGADAAVERTLREIEALRREAQSSIIVPNTGGGFGGGLGGGGLIQRP
jgi:hypothetical protein